MLKGQKGIHGYCDTEPPELINLSAIWFPHSLAIASVLAQRDIEKFKNRQERFVNR